MRGRLLNVLLAVVAGALGALVVVVGTGVWPVPTATARGVLTTEPSVGDHGATASSTAFPTPPSPVAAAPTTRPEVTPTSSQPPVTATDHAVAPRGTSRFVSLTAHERQRIRPGRWTELRFDGEPSDRPHWHRAGTSTIVPDVTAVAQVCMKVTWVDDPRPGQYYLQIARDPHGRVDVTGAENVPNTPGRDYRAGCWVMTIRQGQPLALRVKHDGPATTSVNFAEFKVWVP